MPVAGLPEVIGRYRVLDLLGQGGMGRVLLARDDAAERDVALKLYEGDDAESRYMFARAAKALASLSHPNILAVYQFIEEPLFIACEVIDGPTLRTMLDERGVPLAAVEAANIAYALAQALEHAHTWGIVHRDVKPENVFCARSGRVVLADFGLAKPAGKHATLATSLYGSPAYMAPEQYMGSPADARSDLHALGVTLFEMLAGAPPYDGATVLEIEANVTQGRRRALPSGIAPEPLVRLVEQLLATDPSQRPVHARAVAERLQHVIDAFPPEVVTRTSYARVATSGIGNVRRLWPLALIAAAVAGLVFWFQRPVASAGGVPVVLYFEGTAELSVDGVGIGTAQEPYRIELTPGKHRVEARVYDSGRTLAKNVVIVAGGEAQIRLE